MKSAAELRRHLAIRSGPLNTYNKARRSAGRASVLAAVAVATASQLWGGSSARAADLYLGGDGLGTVQTGSGIWDTTLNRWAPTSTSVAPFVPWVDSSNAIFTGPGGTVTLAGGGGALTTGGLNVQSGKYFIESS